MKSRVAALRYARALENALESQDLARSADELQAFASAMDGDPLIAVALRNPGFETAAKKRLLGNVAKMAGFSPSTTAFLALLVERAGIGLVPQIAEHVGLARDRRLGIVMAEVTTAAPLSTDLAERTRQALERSTGRTVRMSFKTDSSLIGGMIARVGSVVYDGSVRTRLAALRSHLVRS